MPQQNKNAYGEMSLTARIIVFLGVPVLFGLFGFALAHIEKIRDPSHEVDITRDFVWPWGLGMALVTVIGFRTGGFRRGIVQKPLIDVKITSRGLSFTNTNKNANDDKKKNE